MNIVRDRTDDFVQRVREEASVTLLEAANFLRDRLIQAYSTSYPPASVPGEFPHGRTWGGRDAVTVVPSDPHEIARTGYVRIGFLEDAWYMVYLELEKKRLGLFYMYQLLKPQIAMILSRSKMRTTASTSR